jgi:trimeric autotransporter adhesin
MWDARRPTGRLFYLLLIVWLAVAVSQAATPATTRIQDVVYRADGTPAAGTLLISWPTFSTAAVVHVSGTETVVVQPRPGRTGERGGR